VEIDLDSSRLQQTKQKPIHKNKSEEGSPRGAGLFHLESLSPRAWLVSASELLNKGFDRLDYYSFFQRDKVLVLTLFVSDSNTLGREAKIRTEVPLTGAQDAVSFDSLRELWPRAMLLEHQASKEFGIEFVPELGEHKHRERLGIQIERVHMSDGFPMRKDFSWDGKLDLGVSGDSVPNGDADE